MAYIEEYCETHDTAKSGRFKKLVEISYDLTTCGTDSDAYFLEKLITQEKNPEFKATLEELDEYLLGVW